VAGRDYDGLEARRLRAARLFAANRLKEAQIARVLAVSAVSVYRWHRAWRQGGTLALLGAGRAGRRRKLTRSQIILLEQALLEGAPAHGFRVQGWTASNVARLIERIAGVSFHRTHVWRILRDVLHWVPEHSCARNPEWRPPRPPHRRSAK
jgi:transposase